jgi:membrane protein
MIVSFYIAASLEVKDQDIFQLKFLAYLLNWLAFWFAYQFIPYTRVRFGAAFVGAIVGGTMWEIAKGAFNWYITNMTAFDKVYGALGAVPVFLLWIYLTWLIVLFGAEVAYAVQYPRERSHLTQAELANYLEFYSVRAMAEIVRRFNAQDDGAASAIDSLRNIGIPPEILGDILNRLSEKHLIVYTEDKDYVPARKPSSIMVREVVEAVSGKKMLAPENATDPVSNRLRKTFHEIATGVDSALDELDLNGLIEERD